MEVLLVSLGVLMLYMSTLYLIGFFLRNNGVADVGYGIAFMVLIYTVLHYFPFRPPLTLLLSLLPFIWGARLALRIFRKNYGKPEDFRYRAWREVWGIIFVLRSYFQIYILQGFVVFVVALPITLSILFPKDIPNVGLVMCGLAIWCVGFLCEVVGDWQLDRFLGKPENKGKIMTRGLWKYSRHPNYFGESLLWWGIAVMALGITHYSYVIFLSPLLITFLLLKVSGVPMLEKRWVGNPEWEAYASRTSVFIPLPPRR